MGYLFIGGIKFELEFLEEEAIYWRGLLGFVVGLGSF